MTLAWILLALRLLGAFLLLAFLGVLIWFIYRDLQILTVSLQSQQRFYGYLRLVADGSEQIPIDTLFPLLAVTGIGRAPGNVIVLDDGYVSAEHALVSRRDGKWWVEDLQSRNGTLLNDLPLRGTAVLSTGDRVQVGGFQLRLELAEDPA